MRTAGDIALQLVAGLASRIARRAMMAVVISVAMSPGQLVAQIMHVSSLEAYEPGQSGLVTIDWGGDPAVDGLVVTLPFEWTLVSARAYDSKFGLEELGIDRTREGAAVIAGTNKFREACTLLIEFVAGQSMVRDVVRLTPATRSSGNWTEVNRNTVIKMASAQRQAVATGERANRIGAFGNGGRVILEPGVLPRLQPGATHGVSAWIRTTSTDEVILSDWNGVEEVTYNLELMVAGDGTLAFYRGRPGRHESMRSSRLVADGRWHHIAMAHDADEGWTRLFVDGSVVDSLKQPPIDAAVARSTVVVGGRRMSAADGAVADRGLGEPIPEFGFTGFLDDVEFWSTELVGKPDFDLDFEDDALVGDVEIVPAVVARHDPISELHATVEGSEIELSWTSYDALAREYSIDRSYDGTRFTEIGRLTPDRGFGGRFVFADVPLDGEVVYYRVRQLFVNGGSTTSAILKLGLADVMESDGLDPDLVVSNFPNPFRLSTSVRYEIPVDGRVEVSVWDLSGQPVVVLVDGVQAAGAYNVQFVAGDLSAGTYFVRVQQGESIKSHKLLVVK